MRGLPMDGLLLTISDQIHKHSVLIGCARYEPRLSVVGEDRKILRHIGNIGTSVT